MSNSISCEEFFGDAWPPIDAYIKTMKNPKSKGPVLVGLKQYTIVTGESVINPTDDGCRKYLAFLERAESSGQYRITTVRQKIACLCAFGNFYFSSLWAAELDFNNNPYKKILSSHTQGYPEISLDRIPSSAEISMLFNACIDTRERALLLLFAKCALTTREVVSLKTSDIFVDASGNYGLSIRTRGNSVKIKIPLDVVAALDECVRSSSIAPGSRYIFLGERGKPLTSRGVQRMMQKISSRAGLSFTARDIRQSSITHMLATTNDQGAVIDYANICPIWVFRYHDAIDELTGTKPCDNIFGEI